LKKDLTKIFCVFIISTTVFCSCNQTTKNQDKTTHFQKGDTIKYKGLHGTWARHNKAGFTLIEIIDTSKVLNHQFLDRDAELGVSNTDRYWYYKSAATLAYLDSSTISIGTDKFRFDYKLKGDTLIEFDKMGDQGIFVKLKTDEDV